MKNLKTHLLLLSLSVLTVRAQNLLLSHPHGFYDEPFQVRVNWDKGDVPNWTSFRFTVDGSEPVLTSPVFPKSLQVRGNTLLRIAAFNDTARVTPVVTATYLFLDDVMRQSNTPEGYPEFWGNYCQIQGQAIADYEMDSLMVADKTLAPKIRKGLTAIPTLSVVTDKDNFFSHEIDDEHGGIYIYTGTPVGDGVGRGWERPVSMELFGGDGSVDVTVDCGVKLHGGHSRLPEKSPKHSLRLMFKKEWGAGKLKCALFGEQGPKKFDQLVLRCAFGNTWTHWDNTQRRRAQYERDMWARTTQMLLGHPSSRGKYVHLYINGLYWGLYNMAERIDGNYCANNFGGNKADYDVIKVEEDHSGHSIEPVDGTMDAWRAMHKLVSKAATSNADYFQLIGCDSNGEPSDEVDALLDVDNFIDFMLINQYGGNTDWDHHNWLAYRRRDDAPVPVGAEVSNPGFRFICWDSELIFASRGDNNLTYNNSDCPTSILHRLVENPNFLHRYMDRAYQLLVEREGLLTPDRVAAVWDSLYSIIELPLYDEAARWGDYRYNVHPYNKQGDYYTVDNHYMNERNRLLSQYFPERSDSLVEMLKNQGWYSTLAIPQIRVNGVVDDDISVLAVGDQLTFQTSAVIYYTIDGSRPVDWVTTSGGRVAPTAHRYMGRNIVENYDWSSSDTLIVRAICRYGTDWGPLTQRTFRIDRATDIVEITQNAEENMWAPPINIYDLQGRRIISTSALSSSRLPKGVYIINGKKVVVR